MKGNRMAEKPLPASSPAMTYKQVHQIALKENFAEKLPDQSSTSLERILDQLNHQFKDSRNAQKLASCDPASIAACIKYCCLMGLEPGYGDGPSEVYLIPYGNTCKAQVSYVGAVKMVMNSGAYAAIYSNIVYESDEFAVWTDIDGQRFTHKVNDFDSRKEEDIRCVYAVAKAKNGEIYIEVMTKEQIDNLEKKTRKGSKQTDAWISWWGQMARKTVLRRLIKTLPNTTSETAAMDHLEAKEYETIEVNDEPKKDMIKQLRSADS